MNLSDPQAPSLSASYAYDAADRVTGVTYGNGTKTLYTYDDAGRVTLIRHEKSDQSTLLQLGYGYTPDGLIATVTEIDDALRTTLTTYGYDNRNRLVSEQRVACSSLGASMGDAATCPLQAADMPLVGLYHLEYTYDQGGNRLSKTDFAASERTEYHYDVENPPFYHTKNNRLMYYEVYDISDPQVPILTEKAYYEYEGSWSDGAGNPSVIVHESYQDGLPLSYAATDLQYNMQGELWFVTERHWDPADQWCENQVRDRITEFRGNGRGRYMVRGRNPAIIGDVDMAWQVLAGTAVWSDYDGDVIYGDYVVDEPSGVLTDKTAYLPGVGQMDSQTGAVTYYHADHLGTLRATSDGAGQLASRLVQSAFGETVSADGSPETRYQYGGESGYESGLLPTVGQPSEPNHISGHSWQHVGHRWYDPSTGRFLQRDPIGIAGGLNVYAYVRGTPTAATDPLGLMSPPSISWPQGWPPPPGVTPGLCGRRDIDYMDLFSIAHFLIPGLLSQIIGNGPTIRLVHQFEFVEPHLQKINPAYYYETEENLTGDILIGWAGALLL